jgi:hypothetical protein
VLVSKKYDDKFNVYADYAKNPDFLTDHKRKKKLLLEKKKKKKKKESEKVKPTPDQI